MSYFYRISQLVNACFVLAVGAALIPSHAFAQRANYEISDRSDGGAMVTFLSGCKIVHDDLANRGGHSGGCSQYEYRNADKAAATYLGGGSSRMAMRVNQMER